MFPILTCQKMCEATTCDQLFVEFLASLISLCISLAYSSICDIPVVYITLYIFIYSISSLCVSREIVYLQILSLHLPMDYVLWFCFLFMRFSDLKNKQALFEKDERLIFKRFEKICLLSKQISMKTFCGIFHPFGKIKVEMELSFLFQQLRHCSLCVCCLFWKCPHLSLFCFWFR